MIGKHFIGGQGTRKNLPSQGTRGFVTKLAVSPTDYLRGKSLNFFVKATFFCLIAYVAFAIISLPNTRKRLGHPVKTVSTDDMDFLYVSADRIRRGSKCLRWTRMEHFIFTRLRCCAREILSNV